ncbi:MAG TPA: DUF2332 domain-containing protein [Actinomycetota bacterium]|nr:DUF2332 domain-containing protein [Actinomycetota bacterium]
MDGARELVATWFRWQAGWCAALGSPLYDELLTRAADDVAEGGPVWDVVAGMENDPPDSAPALRFMGAVHRLVLEGRAPDLAARYPSAGGHLDVATTWPLFRDTVVAHPDELRASTRRPVQTNEVARAGALVGGFLTVATETGLPLRTLECGASAGFLMNWDRYRYEARGATWGPAESPVRLCDYNSERPLPFDVNAEVVDRSGCDTAPVDATEPEGRVTLLSYVWPDQAGRVRQLRGALEVAAKFPPRVERASAVEWLGQQKLLPGTATVLYHSIFFQYLSPDDRARFTATIEALGDRATNDAPFAWLRFEPGGDDAHTRLKLWPGGEDRLVAASGYHGTAVRWLA